MSVSGLQCPACGHIHQVAELAGLHSGDTFRCRGCQRLLSVPNGMDPPPRPSPSNFLDDPDPTGTDGISFPFGLTVTDMDRQRLGSGGGPATAGAPTTRERQVFSQRSAPERSAPERPAPERPAPERTSRQPASSSWADPEPAPAPSAPPQRPRPAATSAPALETAPADGHVATIVRFGIWLVALPAGLLITVAFLRATGLLEIDHIIDAYAGTGLSRYRILFLLVPVWAALSSTAAHFGIEYAARRRRRR